MLSNWINEWVRFSSPTHFYVGNTIPHFGHIPMIVSSRILAIIRRYPCFFANFTVILNYIRFIGNNILDLQCVLNKSVMVYKNERRTIIYE